ncbi:MAG TPA: hypothetical protein ENI05_00460 [Porticoccus sp.]|nr:hypothetical protein [Porticoccus sp.]
MALEHMKAEMLLGYQFFPHPDMATLGVLRLDTENEQHWVLVTKQSLRELAKACTKHLGDLEEAQ